MRLRTTQNGITINAVAGTSAVLLSLDMDESKTADFMGFYIRKENLSQPNRNYDVESTRYFADVVDTPLEGARYNTKEHPWQSFLWEDFSVEDGKEYKYIFTPVYGSPGALTYGKKAAIKVQIPKRGDGEHEVHFNRGVAGSQAYAAKFGNERPDEMEEGKRERALKWLSKGLKEALLGFIAKAKDDSWQLRCCFYEFIFPEVLAELKAADERGADVKIIYDSRHEADKNDAAIRKAKLPRRLVKRRTSNPAYLQHNKFMVLLKNEKPVAVWLGSTNITEKAIYGHCNVGHIIRNKEVAAKYLSYWNCLFTDPANAEAREACQQIQADLENVATGMTTLFSPRAKTKTLTLYSKLVSESKQLVCGMFPFSFNKSIKEAIAADTNNLKYIIMDKKGKNTTLSSNDFDNVIVYGTAFKNGLYTWAKEKNSGEIFYNGVNFIHNKVILIDPLGEDPVVITGSANFSNNSILRNDENTVVIRGNKHVADLYFTEFARIFNHHSVRQDIQKLTPANTRAGRNPTHLYTDPAEWVGSFYKPNKLKQKRRKMFSEMKAAQA